uniref:Purine permease 2-like n=1 Tax=Nicotiana tabacum TaxID=4097 RepID=A0A1S3Z4S0_TOBAC|nr:PREDICTED: purine permease 2-like [Nicotiana tabacum]
MFAIGNCGGPLILRLYFINGGQRLWLSSWLQTVACPIILIPLTISYFHRRKIEGPAAKVFFITRQELIGAAGVGIIAGLDVKQKLTVYSAFAVVLLIAGAATLALRLNGDQPAGESAVDYVLGFVTTLLGAVCFGLMLPLIELIYTKAKQAITYTTVLEIQMIIAISATGFCTVGMIINKDFQGSSAITVSPPMSSGCNVKKLKSRSLPLKAIQNFAFENRTF